MRFTRRFLSWWSSAAVDSYSFLFVFVLEILHLNGVDLINAHRDTRSRSPCEFVFFGFELDFVLLFVTHVGQMAMMAQ
jgi:hypothetical protein